MQLCRQSNQELISVCMQLVFICINKFCLLCLQCQMFLSPRPLSSPPTTHTHTHTHTIIHLLTGHLRSFTFSLQWTVPPPLMTSPAQQSPYYLTTPQDPTNQIHSLVCIPWVSQDTGLAENEPNCQHPRVEHCQIGEGGRGERKSKM